MLKINNSLTVWVLAIALFCLLIQFGFKVSKPMTSSLTDSFYKLSKDNGVTEAIKERSYQVLEGNSLLVICNVTDSPDIEVFWTKNDTSSAFMHQGKRLEISHINRSNSGDYICHALNTSFPVRDYNETDVNKTVEVINVDVQYPAEINFFEINPYVVPENGTYTFSCDIEGNPNPAWAIRNRDTGNQIVGAVGIGNNISGSTTAQCDSTGYVECIAYNRLNHGANASKGHNLTVYCAPRPHPQQKEYAVKTAVGKYTEMKMYLLGYPQPNCTWSKDDGTAIPKSVKQDDFAKETTLTFPGISVPDFGNYTLKMQNKYGTYFARYQLIAYGPPEMPTNLNFSDVTHNSVRLHWTSGFDMGSRQRFIAMRLLGNSYSAISNMLYDNSTNHGINQNWTYILTGLVSNTQYTLTIVSSNDEDWESAFPKPSISFKTKEYPDNDTPSSKVKLIVGLTLGTLGTLGMLAFIVYILKYRGLRTTYSRMDGKRDRI